MLTGFTSTSPTLSALLESRVAKTVHDLVKRESSEHLFNHCMRTFLFAESLGTTDNLRFNAETLFFASLMHDLGLVPAFYGSTRFEVDGADAARDILIKEGVTSGVAELVWDAIALHATPHIPLRKQPEVSLLHQATSLDTMGSRIRNIPGERLKRILEEYPRMNMKQKIVDDLVDYLKQNPAGGMGYWMAEIAKKHIPGAPCSTFEDALGASPFSE
jgi:hypothetical protein